jgi:hypothetical protein
MHKRFLALVLGLLTLLLVAFAATATAAEPPGVQTADQSATSGQAALAASEATQTEPTNTNISVRVLSPGDDGSVSQTNSVDSSAEASNENETTQDADQSQSGAGGIQVADQSASNAQLAAALSTASQYGASNTNIPVRVLSPGDGGSVTQSNDASSKASSSNENETEQNVDQSQAGGSTCGCEADAAPVQAADQSAKSGQAGLAGSETEQKKPENDNAPAGVASKGDGGSVDQSNSADSSAKAKNDNDTSQSSDQSQGGSGSGTGIQTSDQSAKNEQIAAAASTAKQDKPKNMNISVRVLSPGDDGDVTQSNSVSSKAKASNDNDTTQSVDQDQSGSGSSCGCKGPVNVQTADQDAKNKQGALAVSSASQDGAKNVNIPVRVLSPGDNGSVDQSNSVSSSAKASNDNDLDQSADQDISGGSKDAKDGKYGHDCGCDSSTGIQTADQSAKSDQAALGFSAATQEDAKNVNVPVRVGSKGDDGYVTQSNDVSSKAKASNDNDTDQSIDQDTSGKGSGTSVQTADQKADSAQLAAAASFATQDGASNVNVPVRVGSKGDGGYVDQSNSADSSAKAANDNDLDQSIEQDPSGKGKDGKDGHDCGCKSPTSIQTADQKAENEQAAVALSNAEQDFGKDKCGCESGGNYNTPIRVDSKGDDGDVYQSNDVSSKAKAKNDNDTDQSIDQDTSGGSGTGVQTADQKADSAQLAAAASFATQDGAKNSNAPVRVKSKGDSGYVDQSNSADSSAKASNDNDLDQSVDQDISGGSKDGKDGHSCGCDSSIGIQTADQKAKNEQAALALSATVQKDAKNDNSPVRVKSKGDDGDVFQSNDASSKAKASNDNDTDQSIDQDIAGKGSGTSVQTADQNAKSEQLAAAASATFQIGAKNSNAPVRVKSKGDGGYVDQSNSADSSAKASNDNDLDQDISQDPTSKGSDKKDGHDCGCESIGVQIADQSAKNEQAALAFSATVQKDAKNDNSPVRVKSKGDDGDVFQSNDASSKAKASNDNDTDQSIDQDISDGSGIGIQVAGQEAKSEQLAAAASATFQIGAKNDNSPVRVKSKGDGGYVDQSNSADSSAKASNDNDTKQDAEQDLSGGKDHKCGCDDSIGIQALGQKSVNKQAALAASLTVQDFGKDECGCKSGGNSNSPTRVYSRGDDGYVAQSNSADSSAKADNDNSTHQDGDQSQSGGSGIAIQALGQEAHSAQLAAALSATFQLGASNDNSPTRVYSSGDGGWVTQSNDASSKAKADNDNRTKQDGDQYIGGSHDCKCGDGVHIQALGQSAFNFQLAKALSATFQLKPKNENGGAAVKSRGDAGSTEQSNDADSFGGGFNDNRASQDGSQRQS